MARTKQEITIHGEFEITEDFMEELCDLIEDHFDCELYAAGRIPMPDLESAVLE
jgi:hypothetical protein